MKAFADWYYAYATTYELMRVAVRPVPLQSRPTSHLTGGCGGSRVAVLSTQQLCSALRRLNKLRVTFDKASSAARSDVLQAIGQVPTLTACSEARRTWTHVAPTRLRNCRSLALARGTAVGIDQAMAAERHAERRAPVVEL